MQCQVATGRSDDYLETVTSYGRRRRRSVVTDMEQAEKGDILSMTMLSKSILVHPHATISAGSSSDWIKFKEEPFSKTNITVIKSTLSKSGKGSTDESDDYRRGTSQTSKISTLYRQALSERKKERNFSGTDYVRVSISNHQGYICFEPLNLFIICALSFCVQGIIFLLLFYVILRSTAIVCGGVSVPTSQSRPHLYTIGSQSYNFMH